MTTEATTTLYNGFAIAIDEAIHTKEDRIKSIVEQIESKGVPLCTYTALPASENFFQHLKSVGFIILDWDLNSSPAIENAPTLPEAVKNQAFNENVEFLRKVRQSSFAPVFILTNQPDIALDWLEEHGADIYDSENPDRNFILVQSKKSVTEKDLLFQTIEDWIKANPALYTLKVWDKTFSEAKNDLFGELFSKSPKWPEVLWKSFEDDMVDPVANFNESIFRLIMSRTILKDLQRELIVGTSDHPINKEEIKEVVKGLMYLDDSKLSPGEVRPGDVFKVKGSYLLNVRPECDTITGRCDGEVYLIKGSKLTANQLKTHFEGRYTKDMGIREQHDETVLFGIDGNDFVLFKFNEIRKEKFAELINSGKRKCRVLSPFVNNIQQKYAAYTGRVGLPKFPHDLMREIVPTVAD